jgi:hypothetical protein
MQKAADESMGNVSRALAYAVLSFGLSVGADFYQSQTQAADSPKSLPLTGEVSTSGLKTMQPKLDHTKITPFKLQTEQFEMQDERQLLREGGAKTDSGSDTLKANVNRFDLRAQNSFKLLANYNLELIVDRSLSMRRPDCPGGLSRWQWCGEQAATLASSLAPFTPNGLTIIPFAREYDVFEHAQARDISTLFSSVELQRGTRLYEPLAERMDNYFAHRGSVKPLLVVVITDGMPAPRFEPPLVRKELIETSERMSSATEVTVIFCQIGNNDPVGKDYLQDLDQNLVNEGARYHFVHTIPFQELQDKGLGPCLAASIQALAPVAVPNVHEQSSKMKNTISMHSPTATKPNHPSVQPTVRKNNP